jgi:putative endonuclease
MKCYYVYITTNATRTVLYTGMTNDLSKRLEQHLSAETPTAFTAKYGVYRLLYFEEYQDVRYAIAREKEIKGWRREKKIRLIETMNPYWKFLDEKEI